MLEELYAFRLEFYTPEEESLSYQEYESLDLRKLTIACMPSTFCHFPLKALHNVKELYIEINQVYRGFMRFPLFFHNLTNLGLYSINSNWHLLAQVLNHCPSLQNVELSEGTANGIREDVHENWEDHPIFVPQSLSLQLKTCKLLNFLGEEGELLLARYILKNARVLQTMKIHCSDDPKIGRELLLCPRAGPLLHVKLLLNVNKLCKYQFFY
ncbi:putative FBD domain, leucine-rich repeat domain, L domain-containing protein [Medicago truncatula]|uniref:Putative FBD domain, leucine-rich repeat domain, L domain-containing protein n=1 Tax=Medicago truncatula TaxID=3880 RepID=A0A396IZS3_MEDTR|nr:putative FBD domain, leucine-rich repeat domain, L domain-containing protein [Medicago truncatula]